MLWLGRSGIRRERGGEECVCFIGNFVRERDG